MATSHSKRESDGRRKKPRHGHSMPREGNCYREFRIWSAMKRRCFDPNVKEFRRYGGRGITVCDRWRHDFMAFLADMGARPSKEHSLDRRDNDKGYTCGKCEECLRNGWTANCRWATREVQLANMRKNVFWELNGRRQTISQWAHELGMNQMVLRIRVFRLGWTIEEALTTPRRKGDPSPQWLKVQARNRVNHAIAAGKMPKPSTLPCAVCGKPAQHYHHRSGYGEDQQLDVEPRCQRCNTRNV